jgi:uncharacterized membrane protein YphA (DoxX/SURF4 family)
MVNAMTLSAALPIIRLVVGGIFVGHALQKVSHVGGGHGLKGTAAGCEQMGCGRRVCGCRRRRPARLWEGLSSPRG